MDGWHFMQMSWVLCPRWINGRETRVQLSSNSRTTLVYAQSYSQSSIQKKSVIITNCWVGENVNDWITLHLSASVFFRKMRSIDRNDGRFRLTICIVLGEIRLNRCKMRLKIHYKDRLQAFTLQANQFRAGTCRCGSRSSMQKAKLIGYDNNKNGAYA